MSQLREINKLPQMPINLTIKGKDVLHELITNLIFPQKDKTKVAPNCVLFIPGNLAFLHNLIPAVKELVCKNKFSKIVISGGINSAFCDKTTKDGFRKNPEVDILKALYSQAGRYDAREILTKSEASIIRDRLKRANIQLPIETEEEAENLQQNFQNSLNNGRLNKQDKFYILASLESATRVKATAKRWQINHDIVSYTPTVPTINLIIDRENWIKNPLSRQYVWGEVIRLNKYGLDRKDIILEEKEACQLRTIKKHIATTEAVLQTINARAKER